MTGRVRPGTAQVARVTRSLSGPGKPGAHTGPALVAGRRDGRHDVRLLTGLLMPPVAMPGDRAPARPMWQGHIHLVAAPARPAGRRAHPGNDCDRAGDARWAAGAACRLPTVARAGRAGPGRVKVRARAAAVAARARTEPELFTEPSRRGLRVRPDPGRRRPGEATGPVTVPGDRTEAGQPVWSGGGTLARAPAVPVLRRRAIPAGPGR